MTQRCSFSRSPMKKTSQTNPQLHSWLLFGKCTCMDVEISGHFGQNSALWGPTARVFAWCECEKWAFGRQKALSNLHWTHVDLADKFLPHDSCFLHSCLPNHSLRDLRCPVGWNRKVLSGSAVASDWGLVGPQDNSVTLTLTPRDVP